MFRSQGPGIPQTGVVLGGSQISQHVAPAGTCSTGEYNKLDIPRSVAFTPKLESELKLLFCFIPQFPVNRMGTKRAKKKKKKETGSPQTCFKLSVGSCSPVLHGSSRVLAAAHAHHDHSKEEEEGGCGKAHAVHGLVAQEAAAVSVDLDPQHRAAALAEAGELQG